MQRFTPLLVEAARPCWRAVGDRWFLDETYVKVVGVWRYVYRAARVIIRGHAFVQNLRRGHYELGVDARNRHLRVAAAFHELATTI